MPLNSIYLAAIPLAIWLYLLLGRGNFWKLHEDDIAPKPLENWPRVIAVVPARNEAGTITRAVVSLVSQDYPGELEIVVVDDQSGDGTATLAHFSRDDRRRLARTLVEWPLPVVGTRGYTFAEATAGGVALTEIDPATMESRVCPGLFLVGEVLDVDGRIGGFNFQWAWSTGFVAGRALGRDGP